MCTVDPGLGFGNFNPELLPDFPSSAVGFPPGSDGFELTMVGFPPGSDGLLPAMVGFPPGIGGLFATAGFAPGNDGLLPAIVGLLLLLLLLLLLAMAGFVLPPGNVEPEVPDGFSLTPNAPPPPPPLPLLPRLLPASGSVLLLPENEDPFN